MLHDARLIQRHFPGQATRIMGVVAALSASGLGLGVGLLLLR